MKGNNRHSVKAQFILCDCNQLKPRAIAYK